MIGDANALSEPTKSAKADADYSAQPAKEIANPSGSTISVDSNKAGADADAKRCSPDPSHNTDKYRLVTPFWLQI